MQRRNAAYGNIFGVNLSARILHGRWEICHCTQAYARTWNFMRCSASINPSLPASPSASVRIRCLPSGYLCASIVRVHMYSLLSCSLFDNIDSGVGPAAGPPSPNIRLSHLSSTRFFCLTLTSVSLARCHSAIMWYCLQIYIIRTQSKKAVQSFLFCN